MSEAIALVTFDDYLAGEQRSEIRHEYVGGRVFVMAGGSERHDLAAGFVYEAVAAAARARGCRPFIGNRLVRTEPGSSYYPDVMVVCGPAANRLYERDPAFVVEVLSPSMADTDRREKAVAFTRSPALTRYVLVDPDRCRIEVASMVSGTVRWRVHGPGEIVDLDFATIVVDDLYDAIDATATPPAG
jgi:Uma2 family endonuclease